MTRASNRLADEEWQLFRTLTARLVAAHCLSESAAATVEHVVDRLLNELGDGSLSPSQRGELLVLLGLHSDGRRRAEAALCRILKGSEQEHRRPVWRRNGAIGRGIDWARTATESVNRADPVYWHRTVESSIDEPARLALIALGLRWARLLERLGNDIDGFRVRAAALHDAVGLAAGLRRSGSPNAMSPETVLLRLAKRTDATARDARTVIEGLYTGRQRLSAELTVEMLGRCLGCAAVDANGTSRGMPTVLELLVRASIVQVAAESGWTIVEALTDTWTAVLECKTTGMRCEVGAVKDATRVACGLPDDSVASAARGLGLEKDVRATRPDLLVRFTPLAMSVCPGLPRRIFMGDAKRNASGDGSAYTMPSIQRAVAWMVSYSAEGALDLQLDAQSGTLQRRIPGGSKAPAFTIFFLKGLKDAGGASATGALTALSIERDFTSIASNHPDVAFENTGIFRWFNGLVADARDALGSELGSHGAVTSLGLVD